MMPLRCVLLLFVHVSAALRVGGAGLGRRQVISALTSAALLSPQAPAAADTGAAALFAQRFSVAGSITPLPPLGQYSRYEDQLSTPKGSKLLSLTVKFDFPQQFQQIGRALGGIQFVDGNSGLGLETRGLSWYTRRWLTN